jgi:hypothetical protein
MNRARLLALSALSLPFAAPAFAQGRWSSSSAVIYESYDFGQGLIFSRVSELTVPIGLTYRFGQLGNIAVSTGYASVSLKSADPALLADQTLSGFLNTEARLSVNVLPGKVIALITGAVPTGIRSVQLEQLSILGALSSDVVGFAASSLGSGGNVGGGVVGAFPLGRWALGLGATFKQPMSFQPVLGEASQLKPGVEMRVRGGLEGPLARRTYMRAAAIWAGTSKDRIGVAGTDSTHNGVGGRLITYLSVNQGLGSSKTFTLYGFDVLRGQPQLEQTAVGAAVLPRGNLFALGARMDVPLGAATVVSPRGEWRSSEAATDATKTAPLRQLGVSLRLGVDLRYRVSRAASLVLRGGWTGGHVVQAGQNVSLSGYRAALHLELVP